MNYYYCEECRVAWDDDWDCPCDDDCPQCGATYTAFDSEEERDTAEENDK